MNKYLINLTDKLYNLYKTYETYAWDSPYRKIVIVFEEQNIISFYLFQNEELLDDIHISFDAKETALYQAISLRLFVVIIGNVMIHKLDNFMYYNAKHKPYLLIATKNNELRKHMDDLVNIQTDENITFETDIVAKASKAVKNKKYSKKFLEAIDKRRELTSDMLRRW